MTGPESAEGSRHNSAYPPSAFGRTMQAMRESLGSAWLDVRSFDRPLVRSPIIRVEAELE